MVPDAVSAAWQSVNDKWDDTGRHDAFIALVAQHSAFAWAAARYKERAGDPIATKQLERLGRAATATMMATASSKPAKQRQPYRGLVVVLICMLLAMVVAFFATRSIRDNGTAQPTKPARH